MILSASELAILRQRPHRTDLFLSIYKPTILMQCRVNDASIARDEMDIFYSGTVSSGAEASVKEGMTLLVGTSAGASDVGKTRIKTVPNGIKFVIAENSDISWQNGLYLTVLNYVDIWTIYPGVSVDPADAESLIFKKDYDIAYTNQNTILGSFPCAGPHRAAFLKSGNVQLYYTAAGTANVAGETPTYLWEFEGGTGSNYNTATPGYITYNTPGHYKTTLTVSTPLGGSDVTYRFVSIYDRENEGGDMPIVKWDMSDLSGSRAEGGYNSTIKVWEHIDDIQDNALVVIFADDWYGSTGTSLGGNAEHSSEIVFVGYITKGSIRYNYRESSAEFSIGSATEIMRQSEGFAISCASVEIPVSWFEIHDMDVPKSLYHYLRWHSTVLKCTDFQYTGDARKHQYLDVDNTSLFDAIDNFLRVCIIGEVVADRQGKIWAEISAGATHEYISTGTTTMTIDNQDWMGEPSIEERQINDVSYLEMGGFSYSGSDTGITAALLSQAPGFAPAYHGKTERLEGLILVDQTKLNDLTGDLFAYKNAKYVVTMDMIGNYRNIDIAPKEKCLLNIGTYDTVRGITFTNKPFHPVSMNWQWNSEKSFLYPNVVFNEVTNGICGETEPIPAETVDVPVTPPKYTPPVIDIPPFTFPNLFAGPKTYTWVVESPGVGGIPGPYLIGSCNVLLINAYCVGATSITFNIEERSVVGIAGTNIMSADLAAYSNYATGVASFALPHLTAGRWLWLDISGKTGAPTKFVVTLAVMIL